MANNYEPNPTIEEDDGYSIPKILVAVLLLVLIGAGVYIYFQQKKLKNSVSYLLESKKQAESELNEMIERYNLAIEDNGELEGDLIDERNRIIHYRDSILKLKKIDFRKNKNYNKTIEDLKTQSSIQLDAEPIIIYNQPVSILDRSNKDAVVVNNPNDANNINKNKTPNNTKTTNNINTSNDTTNSNNTQDTSVTDAKVTIEKTNPTGSLSSVNNPAKTAIETNKTTENISKTTENTEEPTTKVVKKEIITKRAPVKTITNFKRVEMPPTYPGCKGDASTKKLCFSENIKKHLSRKFDATIVDNLDLKPGQKRIWINFNINKYGNITNVSARAPKSMPERARKKLEYEAIRVIKKLPKMIAAKQNGASVEMNYSLPLSFVVQ